MRLPRTTFSAAHLWAGGKVFVSKAAPYSRRKRFPKRSRFPIQPKLERASWFAGAKGRL